MADLICYVPFPRDGGRNGPGDLRTNATELENFVLGTRTLPPTKGGIQLTGKRVVYAGEEVNNPAVAGDVIVVHAHGGRDDSDVGDNLGNELTSTQLMTQLANLQANRASEVYFFVCFSALPQHIGPLFKERHRHIKVYACSTEAQGSLISTTRTGIRSAVWSGNQLEEI